MTAIRTFGKGRGGPVGLTVICDQCGARDDLFDETPGVWTVVWASFTRIGWTGSSQAIGPHRCPACTRMCRDDPSRPRPRPTATAVGPVRREHLQLVAGVAVVTLRGDLDAPAVEVMCGVLADAHRRSRDVVLDVTGVRLVDSAGLSLLVRTHQTARTNGGAACLVAPSRFLQVVLHTMRLHVVFPQFATVADAVAWLTDPAVDHSRPTRTPV